MHVGFADQMVVASTVKPFLANVAADDSVAYFG